MKPALALPHSLALWLADTGVGRTNATMLRHIAQPVAHCATPPPSLAARSLHSSVQLWRGQVPSKRRRVSSDLIKMLKGSTPPSSRQAALARVAERGGNSRPFYKSGGGGGAFGGGYRGGHGNKRRTGPSTVSRGALCAKLRQHLVEVWQGVPEGRGRRRTSPQVRSLAVDLGIDEDELGWLTTRFGAQAAAAVPDEAWQERMKDFDVAAYDISFDIDEIAKTYIEEGPEEALWNASLAAFLAWIRTSVPVPSINPDRPRSISAVTKLHLLASIADHRFAYEHYFTARQRRRKLILHVGPTNSGKTYNALVALARARTGAYAGPLRLLAHEVFSRFNEGKIGQEGPRVCNLVTGEEKRIINPEAGLQSCTVEMFPLTRMLDVGVIDEIQMIGDPQRGAAWTAAVIGSTCDELHLCGEESVVELIQTIAAELGDECVVKRYQRLSPLVVAEKSLEGDLSKIRRGDCLVTFSRSNIFAFKRAVEQRTGLKVAVAYGGLPPEVREEQARAFNAGEFDVLVASDAVGMGLNLCVVSPRACRPSKLTVSPLQQNPPHRFRIGAQVRRQDRGPAADAADQADRRSRGPLRRPHASFAISSRLRPRRRRRGGRGQTG